MKKALLFISLFIAGVLAGMWSHQLITPPPATIVRVDTLRIETPVYDTAYVTRYVSRMLPVHDTCTIRDTVMTRDSVMVEIPIETKIYYKEDAYYAEVEGYEAELTYLELWPRTEYRIVEVTKSPRWSFGVQAGYGVASSGLAPYIGLGVQYRLFPSRARSTEK